MKKIILLCILFFTIITKSQTTENFGLSTLRIGDFKIFMPQEEAQKLTKTPLKVFDDYQKKNKVTINGEDIFITLSDLYENENSYNTYKIYSLSTKSKKFRTKSGMGVGSTRYELLETYKDYPNFEIFQTWGEKIQKQTSNISNFLLNDIDAGTSLNFILVNNIVTEIQIYVNDAGC